MTDQKPTEEECRALRVRARQYLAEILNPQTHEIDALLAIFLTIRAEAEQRGRAEWKAEWDKQWKLVVSERERLIAEAEARGVESMRYAHLDQIRETATQYHQIGRTEGAREERAWWSKRTHIGLLNEREGR